MATENTRLFDPVRVGSSQLAHRIAMAPLTRYRASKDHVPSPLVADYYAQRAAIPGTLLISEGTYISYRAGGYGYVPGLWSAEQLAAWKEITDAVHAKKSKIWCQLWALGRVAKPVPGVEITIVDEGYPYAEHLASSSPVPAGEGFDTPREMSEEEIWRMVDDFAKAAKDAVEVAGFDGVEVHGAHGYLVDQFTQDTCNKRTDAWGGSVENRSRFALEVCKAITAAIGPERVGIRLSPWASVQGMRMDDPVPQFTHLIAGLSQLKLAYLHLVEPRAFEENPSPEENLEFALKAWGKERPVILAGGYTPDLAVQAVERFKDYDVIIAFGRRFISTPDLVYRIKKGIEWEAYDRSTFYRGPAVERNGLEKGYIDYPFSKELLAEFGGAV
ncbi:Nadh:flavin oxidoreductase nadh oxidase family protein [Lasiodiplodia theobromae]|uniref:Nadh:flavin oxidoreductase nadh oxidase family protein n=1 Tax=Lasiodiplodia theobromae TaxID=45133 RepID=UPI0015C3EB84|nr:Nadh:flavin oxidoreductase nadh oxidase family protein [Lasiodiplodia theobromae]KAF4539194.1 Nadh:flavin oxidoreductase nadh oxidase family protein [Lasiodiplodia theobromae]